MQHVYVCMYVCVCVSVRVWAHLFIGFVSRESFTQMQPLYHRRVAIKFHDHTVIQNLKNDNNDSIHWYPTKKSLFYIDSSQVLKVLNLSQLIQL